MDILASAADMIFTLPTVLAILGGTLLGVAIGVLPGLGPAVGVSLALPLTLGLDQVPAIAMLLGIYAGSIYGGSVTAILINTPGTPSSAASCLDGYPMTLKGEAGRALGIAAVASVFGGLFSVAILALFAPRLASWALNFGPAEMLALALFALTCIAAVSEGSMIKGLMGGVLGLFISVVGQDTFTGQVRYDFGIFELSAGLSLVPVLVGLFALSEVFTRLGGANGPVQTITSAGFRMPTFREFRGLTPTFLKGGVVGTILGILPGIGPTAASFVSYAEARRSSKEPETFGKGNPHGLAASESANNAVTGAALVPTLALGVPGDPITAILLGALVIKDIVPGPRLFIQHADTVAALYIVLTVINILILPIAAGFGGVWRRILALPEALLMAMVVVLVTVGIYTLNNSVLDLVTTFTAGVVGYLLRRAGFPLAPIIIGFVLGGMVEENLRMGMIVFEGDWTQFFTHPIAAALLALSVILLARPLYSGAWGRFVAARKSR